VKFAGTNWNTTEQVVRIAQKNGSTKKTNKMKINKKILGLALDKIESDEFTLKELFKEITNEIKDEHTMDRSKFYKAESIMDAVVSVTGMSREMIISKSRVQKIVFARTIAMHLIHKYTRLSMAMTSDIFNCNHSMVIHNNKRVNEAKNGYNPEMGHLLNLCESVLMTEPEN
jgi:chromosomal replication initiation ATPase DnaA